MTRKCQINHNFLVVTLHLQRHLLKQTIITAMLYTFYIICYDLIAINSKFMESR